MKVENQLDLTNVFFKAGFCTEIWGTDQDTKNLDFIITAEKQRKFHNKAWNGQRKESLNKIMDIGFEVGVEVAKECQEDFLSITGQNCHEWAENELDGYLQKIKERHNYKTDKGDKYLIESFAYDVAGAKMYIRQKQEDMTYLTDDVMEKIRKYMESDL